MNTINEPTNKGEGKIVIKKRRKGRFNLLLMLLIIVAIAAFGWAEQQRRVATKQLEQTSTELEELRKNAERSGEEVTDEILVKAGKHISLPGDPKPTVATITDVDSLKKASPFYKNAQNGDALIITKTRAILYSPAKDIIIDVVPVQVDQKAKAPEGNPEGSPNPSESPTPVPVKK